MKILLKRKPTLAVTIATFALVSGMVFTPGFAASLTGGNHAPIIVKSDVDLTLVGSTSGCACVSSGTGGPADPFIIGPWTIMATGSGPGVLIQSVTKVFTLLHITVHGTGGNDGVDIVNVNGLGPKGEHFDNILSANIDGAAIGVSLTNTSGVTIRGDSINNSQLWGIRLDHASRNTVTFMTVSHNGLSQPDSHTLPGALHVFLGHGIAGGVLFQDSANNELSVSQLSEDAYAGFVLVRSDYNTITDVHSRYPDYYGGVLQDSSFNRLDRIDMQTADFVGLVIRGGGSNLITNSDFSANGPIGPEINAKVVPYYISGLYIGWQTHDNKIRFDHSNNGNTGPGLLVDNGAVQNPVTSQVQNVNPFNNASGNDPGSVPTGSAFDAGRLAAAGTGNSYCGNAFASTNLSVNPNAPCP